MAAIPLPYEPEIEYPESDGKPMAESDVRQAVMMHLIQGLRDHYSTEPEVYVAGNLLLYYEEGKRASIAPDVFVVRGVPKRRRDTYPWRIGASEGVGRRLSMRRPSRHGRRCGKPMASWQRSAMRRTS